MNKFSLSVILVCGICGGLVLCTQALSHDACLPYSSYYLIKGDFTFNLGLCKKNGKVILPAKFEHLKCLGKDTGLWWALEKSEGGFAEIYRDSGAKFSNIRFPSSVNWLTGCCGVIALDSGEILVPNGENGPYFFSDIVYPDGYARKLGKGVAPSKDGRYTTILDSEGKVSLYDIPARIAVPGTAFDDILLNQGTACIVTDSGKKGVVDIHGNFLIPFSYYMDMGFVDYGKSDIIYAKQSEQMGIYDPCKRLWLVEPRKNFSIISISENSAAVSNNFKQCIISLNDGKTVLTTSKHLKFQASSGRNGVDFWKLLDEGLSKSGVPVIVGISTNEVFRIENIDQIHVNYSNDGLYVPLFFTVNNSSSKEEGVLSIDGRKFLFPLKKGIVISDWENNIRVKDKHTNTIFIQALDGKVLLDWSVGATNLALYLDSSGYARIVCDGKAGLVDGECKFVLPCRYEDVGHFGEGLVPAKSGGKWGFVSLDGEWAIPARLEEARCFKDGYAPVRIGGKWGFIDKSGKAVTPFDYEDVKDVREGYFRAQMGGKWGIFALDGTCTLPAEYDRILSDDEYGYGDP